MTEFDQAQREETRQALLRYMRQHKIGVPRLARRIRESVERNPIIPEKTLQRFLAGHIRTYDQYVEFFRRFAETNAPPDPVTTAGAALAALYGQNARRDFSGAFHATTQTGEDSNVTISVETGFWRVKEITQYEGRSVFDGVAVSSSEGAFFVLKDRLAGLPRTYTVWPQENDELHGCGTTVRFLNYDFGSTAVPYIRSFEIKLRK